MFLFMQWSNRTMSPLEEFSLWANFEHCYLHVWQIRLWETLRKEAEEKLPILTLAFHYSFVTLFWQNSKVCWLSRFWKDWRGFALKGHPLWDGKAVFCWSEPVGFSIEPWTGLSFPFFLPKGSLLRWIYFTPDTWGFSPLTSFIDRSLGHWHIKPGSNLNPSQREF